MIPKTNSTEIQFDVLVKIREVYEFDSELSDRMLLISIFDNYRTGGGLRLSKLGYTICAENNLYDFTPIPIKSQDRNSMVYTSLDRICTSPYYIKGDVLYLSDELVLAQLTFCRDDFMKLFAAFM
ncbi:hypothetical protein pEaSNUABM50_00207 [Erwinia phage pEa_SNUABM_50]|uniref:Uncharacterized protein n=4 Tax=Eneladusvirus BF TaxID=2560751 RepID=A0A7L8ZND0_9CAUD|nr:hypothetical protein FDH34_gp211 [Serratia phage BF]QOI71148.1 hypothetical protein pEaSNUABM12_00210 [Erwinia phage pEa_SNUABM_12]QOI71692.1 hypothetical protein pEaSNUABM47_00208 [Erwinia phage pEa_SNUABM_47]QOI72231.1 hypothetical protein pEaSNUABM50_00207 [Erwinia phage pEa_SNUABM_50]QXO11357.1 hypothetical protein pEaSNUABM19_00211 [Erwinia phage pEa_SNUABM_19]QXO11905.1 hypothetical protein pEaSNUABM44_00209 [Erwinia phage pEa_SNUABM_44]QXO12457.1 hypothetical protein pEaSNUABM49_002